MRYRQVLLSLTAFALVVGGLMYVDPRVSSRFTQLAAGDGGVSSWGDRLLGIGGIVLSTIRHQSIENAPLMVFAVVGAVLFLFMVRT